ncbi:MAG: ATP-grasp domain-containing protein [Candidatus Woesearchaeota archaeon]
MRFALISGQDGEDVKHIFIEEAKKIFDSVLYVPIDLVRIDLEDNEIKAKYKNVDLTSFDCAYIRVFQKDFLFAEILLDLLESKGIAMPSCLDGYQITNHKYFSVQKVSRIGIPSPDSSLSISPGSALCLGEKLGYPLVLKLLQGYGGKGVMLLKSEEELRPILDTLQVFEEFLSMQSFVPNANTDTRGLVIGEEVIGIRRTGSGNEWRANVSTGGKAEIVELPDDIKQMALSCSQLLGLSICAIDFIETSDGTRFIEANFTPGIMPKYFGGELARKMLLHIKDIALEIKASNDRGYNQ